MQAVKHLPSIFNTRSNSWNFYMKNNFFEKNFTHKVKACLSVKCFMDIHIYQNVIFSLKIFILLRWVWYENSVFSFEFETEFYNNNLDFRWMLKEFWGERRNSFVIYYDTFDIRYGYSSSKKRRCKGIKK